MTGMSGGMWLTSEYGKTVTRPNTKDWQCLSKSNLSSAMSSWTSKRGRMHTMLPCHHTIAMLWHQQLHQFALLHMLLNSAGE